MRDQSASTPHITASARIVSAYVSNNVLPSVSLSGLLIDVHRTIGALDGSGEPLIDEPLKPALPIRKSVTDDQLFCLECGKALKSLKRHLRTAHDLTPEAYRDRWTLPQDYPMIAPSYAEKRSQIAKNIGLGKRR